MKLYDAVVIGGGPAGMTAALYLLRAGVKTAMVEKLSPGGQVLMTSEIENYPGFPKGLQGWELADKFAAHLEEYPLERINDEVRAMEPNGDGHVLKVGEEDVKAKAVVLATGCRYRKLNVPGEDRLLGRGVSYCALCDGNFFRGRDVAVIGGGNSALEEALYLARICGKVHLIHRREAFRGQIIYQQKCFDHENIDIIRSTVVDEIVGETDVESLTLRNVASGESSSLKVDAAFIFVGFEPIIDFVPETVNRDRNGIVTDVEMRTNIPGLFAAGDIRSKLCRQVASAVGDGATAANSAFAYLEQLG
ncbi:thioredoxin-disulfide reductase [Pseudodesulfovibrio sp.]|uniref:thioredoxin-disulfide reductase n=1 Tax=Pseudodesulfovibrio sp. TaxID=2035812 RepID=UPI0026054EAC|nr:thioredoxin-disulfide reductase [Pseudodesulfovibrio sp.]MDD3310815.1 thioredoxin-disulfide reductase [Pseudodesulfovibrio sp.]